MLPFDPKKPLHGFTARFPHAKRRIHLFADERFVYFRPKNAPGDWWGALWPWALLDFPVKHYLVSRVEREINQGRFFRVWAFNNKQRRELWQVHWHPKMGCFYPQHDFKKAAFFFPLPSQMNIFKASTAIIHRHFMEELQDEQSDARKALAFCGLSEEEKSWLSIKWIRGSRRELETILRSTLLLDEEIWHWWKNEKFVLEWDRSSLSIGFGLSSRHARFEGTAKLSQRLHRLIERAIDCNSSFYPHPIGRRDDWAPPWWVGYEQHMNVSRMTIVMLEVNPPTQHERFEAALFLRDWLQQYAPDLLSDWFPNPA